MKLLHKKEEDKQEVYEEFQFSLTDELRAAEQKFYHLFDFNPCPMSVHDLITGIVIDVNQSFIDILGFDSKTKVIGKSIKDFEVIPQKESMIFMKKLLEDGAVNNMIIPFKNLKGKKIRGLFSGTQIDLNDRKCALIVCQVINKQCIINSLFVF